MKGIIMLVKHNLKFMILKKKMSFVFTMIMPIIAVLLISKLMLSSSTGLKVGIVNMDGSNASKYVISQVEENKNIQISNISENNIKENFADNSIQGAIIINKGFGRNISKGNLADFQIVGKEGDMTYKLLQGITSIDLNNMVKLGKIAKGNTSEFNKFLNNYKKENLTVVNKNIKNIAAEYNKATIFIGFLIMFVFYRALFGATRINDDKDDKVFNRIFISTIKPWQYYMANVIASILCISVQIIISIVAVVNISKVDFGMSIPIISCILILAGVVGVSIGTICISITKSTQEASIVSNVVIFTMVMMGGCFIPTSIFPPVMNNISKFLPTRWVMEIIENIQNGQKLINQWHFIIMILLFSIVLMLISAYFTKRKDKSFIEV